MKTAEELKKQAHKPGFVNGLYIFTESELESYAEQVAKEHAIEFCKWLTQHGHNLADHMVYYDKRYNEWINNRH